MSALATAQEKFAPVALADDIAAKQQELEVMQGRLDDAEITANAANALAENLTKARERVDATWKRLTSDLESTEKTYVLAAHYPMKSQRFAELLIAHVVLKRHEKSFRQFLIEQFVRPAEQALKDFKKANAKELKALQLVAAENPKMESLNLHENFYLNGQSAALTRKVLKTSERFNQKTTLKKAA